MRRSGIQHTGTADEQQPCLVLLQAGVTGESFRRRLTRRGRGKRPHGGLDAMLRETATLSEPSGS